MGIYWEKLINHIIDWFRKRKMPIIYLTLNQLVYVAVFYKIISKLLVNRLWSIPHKTIWPLQSVFVWKKDIHNNILIIHKILSSFTLNIKAKDLSQLNWIWKRLMIDWMVLYKEMPIWPMFLWYVGQLDYEISNNYQLSWK